MIYSSLPNDWHELQNQVGQILRECGFRVTIEKDIKTVRGDVNIDVFAQDITREPVSTYLCECKHWQSAIPKSIVHAFRTVVTDCGANWGFIISSGGFQKGAYEAAENSNIQLLGWNEFQDLFVNEWNVTYMLPRIHQEVDPLWEYIEPINTRISRKVESLDPIAYKQILDLREKYSDLVYIIARPFIRPLNIKYGTLPNLPLRNKLPSSGVYKLNIPDDLLDAVALRDFLDILCKYLAEGVSAFDQIFGERA